MIMSCHFHDEATKCDFHLASRFYCFLALLALLKQLDTWRGPHSKKLGWPLANSQWESKTLSLTAWKELDPQSDSPWGTEFCQCPLIWETGLSSVEPLDETSALAGTLIEACGKTWCRRPREVVPKFLTRRNCEIINMYCFKPLNLW